VDEVEVSTVVHLPPAEIYEFVLDFPRYADYSEYLTEVRCDGDGSPGTRYALRFSWWKLTYTARSEVTDVDPPTRVDWRITKDIDARGHWRITPAPERAPEGVETASEVTLRIEYDPDTASASGIDLPRLVSLSWVIEKVKPKIQAEAERVVERIVADLEGEPRDVELTVHTKPDGI